MINHVNHDFADKQTELSILLLYSKITGIVLFTSAFIYYFRTFRQDKKKIKNVSIKLSAHDAFLEKPSSGLLKIQRLETQII